MDLRSLTDLVASRLAAGFGLPPSDVARALAAVDTYKVLHGFLNAEVLCIVCFEGRLESR